MANCRKTLVLAPCFGWPRLPPGVRLMLASARRHRIDVTLVGRGEPWKGFYGSKIVTLRDRTKHLTGYDHVVMVDASDTLFATGLEEMHQRFERFTSAGNDFVISGEMFNWPWPSRFADHPHKDKTFGCLNSGFYMATWPAYIRVMNSLVHRIDDGYSENNQKLKTQDQAAFWVEYVDDHVNQQARIAVDYECQLAQCLCGVTDHEMDFSTERPLNKVTGTRPCVFHANGQCKWRIPQLHKLFTGVEP